MENSIINQTNLFIIFILNGIFIGILFDFFRILRKSFKTSDIITYIQDILFWILAGISILYSIFRFNNGEIRLYIFIGILLGITFYTLIFSKFFININVTIIKYISNTIRSIIKILLIPFIKLLKILRIIFNIFSNFFKKIYKKCIKLTKFSKNTMKKKDFGV